MSGKDDHGLLSANMLQKARSFRDEIAMKIRRSPSTNRDSRSSVTSSGSHGSSTPSSGGGIYATLTSPHKSPKHKRKVSRGGSFKEERQKEKVIKTEMERLETERKKVDNSLLGLKVVAEGKWTHMLHGSATVVLESVMEFRQLIESLVQETDNELLLSAFKKVNSCLAALIQWADQALLHGDTALDVSSAHAHIKAVDDGVKELHSVALDRLKGLREKGKAGSQARKRNSLDGAITKSPLPLTPKEQDLLVSAGHAHGKATTNNNKAESVIDSTDSANQKQPPPKPPLPRNNQALISQSIQKALQGTHKTAESRTSTSQNTPPTLPPKKRTPSVASIYDNHTPEVDSPPRSPSYIQPLQPTQQTPSQSTSHRVVHFSLSEDSPSITPGMNRSSAQNSPFQSDFNSPSSEFNSSQQPQRYGQAIPMRGPSSPGAIVIPIQTRRPSSDENTQQLKSSRISPDRVSNVTSSSRSSSFSLTKSSSATSHTIMLGESGKLGAIPDNGVTESSMTSANAAMTSLHREHSAPAELHDGVIISSSKTEEFSQTSAIRSTLMKNGSKVESSSSVQNAAVKTQENLTTSSSAENMRLSQYDNFDKVISAHRNEQFQSIADQIKQLTIGMEDLQQEVDSKKPPLPTKMKHSPNAGMDGFTQRTRQQFLNRQHMVSRYDNFDDTDVNNSTTPTNNCDVTMRDKNQMQQNGAQFTHHQQQYAQFQAQSYSQHSKALAQTHAQPVIMRSSKSAMEFSTSAARVDHQSGKGYSHTTKQASNMSASHTFSGSGALKDEERHTGQEVVANPPPLPPKRKNVESYMQIFGGGGGVPRNLELLHRQSMAAMQHYHSQWMQHQLELHSNLSFNPPWMMESSEYGRGQSPIMSMWPGHETERGANQNRVVALSGVSEASSGRSSEVFSIQSGSSEDICPPFPPELPAKKAIKSKSHSKQLSPGAKNRQLVPAQVRFADEVQAQPMLAIEDTPQRPEMDSGFSEISVLDDTNVADQLVYSKPGSDEPDIRGGAVDALIVHACSVGVKDILYQEAFLTTYRTFISPHDLIRKLLYRYKLFSQHEQVRKRKLASSAFSLLIRVVDEMCTDMDSAILSLLTETVYRFLSDGSLMLAKILRRKIVEKVEQKRQLAESSTHHLTLWEASHMTTKQYSLLDFHARHLAEQMTLLDAQLFQKIEIPEVLLWPEFQNEEMSPNLTQFTVHFNKVSFWCRTLVLSPEDPKDREKILVKFIKIMKHLRRHNNFNSYLAILSAVDSAPIRRLDWQKQNVEALKEFCELIDSSSSFRAYRQALAEAEPPCIPYIGIILQDLTFVHIGNPDELDGDKNMVNFSKRWQQFQILDNMKRFKKCNYDFKKDHKIVAFFDDFEHSLSEESLWQISEDIRPRGGKKKNK